MDVSISHSVSVSCVCIHTQHLQQQQQQRQRLTSVWRSLALNSKHCNSPELMCAHIALVTGSYSRCMVVVIHTVSKACTQRTFRIIISFLFRWNRVFNVWFRSVREKRSSLSLLTSSSLFVADVVVVVVVVAVTSSVKYNLCKVALLLSSFLSVFFFSILSTEVIYIRRKKTQNENKKKKRLLFGKPLCVSGGQYMIYHINHHNRPDVDCIWIRLSHHFNANRFGFMSALTTVY